MDDLVGRILRNGGTLQNVTVPGYMIAKIFQDSYTAHHDYDSRGHDLEEQSFPHVYEARTFEENKQLILTALIIYRQGYLTINEIQNVLDLFKKFTRRQPTQEGDVREADKIIKIIEYGVMERLIKSMIGINKVLSTAYVRDWCLKCCRWLKATADQFTRTDQLLTATWQMREDFHKSKVLARQILENMHVDLREFLCLMCNAHDR